MHIMKFGGSSVQDAKHIKMVAQIIENAPTSVAIVLSAMKGTTDFLISAASLAEKGNKGYLEKISLIREKHIQTISELFIDKKISEDLSSDIISMLEELENILHGVELIQECTLRSLDYIMSFGERLNCRIFTAYMNYRHPENPEKQALYVDARNCLVTDDQFGRALVDEKASYSKIKKLLASEKKIPVITGFIASTPEGITTTLGRNGSDYSASLFGAALSAEAVEIWTDVDGVYSADPRLVPSAFVVPELSIEEAMELSYFGAKVIHPYTLLPTVKKGIPIIIKNTMNPQAPGTKIWDQAASHSHAITGIASIEDVALLNIVGGGMVGVPGMASTIFSALGKAAVNVIMISQASSEHSICIICKKEEAQRAKESLEEALSAYLNNQRVLRIDLMDDLEIIAVIGENMNGRPGMSGHLFQSLGDSEINVLAIAQGSSERNISFVIHKKDRKKALNTVHNAFLINQETGE